MSSEVENSERRVVVEIGSTRLSGTALDVSGLADPETVATAVREGEAGKVTVNCSVPRPVHDHVGLVRPDLTLSIRPALAAAARSRGHAAPPGDELAVVRERLADLSIPEGGETAAARKRLAGTESAVAACRERVATLRGRIQAGREAGRDVSDVREELAEKIRELSERETERAAAREALDQAERQAREARDARERRRRLQDREANLERAARQALVATVREAYAAAVESVPGGSADGTDPFAADPVPAALAVGRVAALRAPVVLACDRFDDADAAAAWLDAPVIRV